MTFPDRQLPNDYLGILSDFVTRLGRAHQHQGCAKAHSIYLAIQYPADDLQASTFSTLIHGTSRLRARRF